MIGEARSTYGAEEKFVARFSWVNVKEIGYLTKLGVNGRIILKSILKKCTRWECN